MQHMPLITLDWQGRVDILTGGTRGCAAIHDNAVVAQTVVLTLPQQQRPAVSVDGEGAGTGPNRAAMDIDYIEIGATAVVGVDLVQRHRTDTLWQVGCQIAQRALFGLAENGGNGRQADAALRQGTKTGLDVTIRGMRAPDREHLALEWRRDWSGARRRREGLSQRLLSLSAPGIQSRARHAALAAEA